MPEAPPKKINADSFKRGLSLEEKVESNSKKITLIKSTINLRKENVNLRLEKIEDDVDNTNNDLMDGLHSITEALVGVKAILADQVKERLKERRDARKENERLKKKRREDELENKKEKGEGPLKAVGGVAKDIFSRLKKFLTSVVLGAAIINLLEWLKDPKNLDNLKNFAKFLQDHGLKIIGTLAALAAINFIGGLFKIGGALKGILSLVGVKGFLIAASVAAAAATAILIKNEAQKYMDEEYGPDTMGRASWGRSKRNVIDSISEVGKEETIRRLELEKRKFKAENPGFDVWNRAAEYDQNIRFIKEGRYDMYDAALMDPKDLALLEQVEPKFDDARAAWKSFKTDALKIDNLYSGKGSEGKTTEEVLDEVKEIENNQQISKEVIVKSFKDLKTIREAMSNNGTNAFDAIIQRATGVNHSQLFAKNWNKIIQVGTISMTKKEKVAYLDNLLSSGPKSTQNRVEDYIDRAKAGGVESGLKVDESGETLDTEREKFLPPSNRDKVNESVMESGKEETIARLREQKKNLNLWEIMSGVGTKIDEEIYRLETGQEKSYGWNQSSVIDYTDASNAEPLALVTPTTKLIDSKSYSTNKEVAARFDTKTGKAFINEKEVPLDEYNKFQSLSKDDQVNQYGIDKKISNANIDKSNQTSVKSSGGIESVASNKTPKINLLPITGGGQSKVASSSGNFGNNSVVFSSEDPTQSNFAIQGIYNVSPA